MAYWLMKSEPSVYSWSQLVKDKRTWWGGVRNHQANNNMKAMRKGDRAFFYHSNEERAIVGVMQVTGLWKLDPDDESGKFGMVEVKAVTTVQPITLIIMKTHKQLTNMSFLKQSRLSVSSVTDQEWEMITAIRDAAHT